MQRPPRLTVDGAAVRDERMRQGLEIADVAARVGISRSFLSRIELHSVPIRPRTYRSLCKALNCEDIPPPAPSGAQPEEEE